MVIAATRALATVLMSVLSFFAVAASEPALTIKAGGEERVFTRSALLSRPDAEMIRIVQDPAYPGREMTYRAVPIAALFEGMAIAEDVVIQFRCLDGYSAPIAKERLLNRNPAKSRAFVAVEPTGESWPALKPGAPSAGPFYLVWPQPGLSFISPEEWPYQLTAFEVKGKLAEVYPRILPDPQLKPGHPVRLGFELFVKHCFACHTLNHEGTSQIGPDLNLPMNPTEYYRKGVLERLIRDPQSVRKYPQSRMSGFSPAVLPDRELAHLVAYLEHMAKRKRD